MSWHEEQRDFINGGVRVPGARDLTFSIWLSRLHEEIRLEKTGGKGDNDVQRFQRMPSEPTYGDARYEVVEMWHIRGDLIGRVVGKGGDIIRAIQQKIGVKVDIEQKNLPPGESPQVWVGGTREQVDKAKAIIDELGNGGLIAADRIKAELFSSANNTGAQAGLVSHVVKCPLATLARIIGKQGNTVKAIQQESGARVEIDQRTGDPANINVHGTWENVQRGVQMIIDLATGILKPPDTQLSSSFVNTNVGGGYGYGGGLAGQGGYLPPSRANSQGGPVG